MTVTFSTSISCSWWLHCLSWETLQSAPFALLSQFQIPLNCRFLELWRAATAVTAATACSTCSCWWAPSFLFTRPWGTTCGHLCYAPCSFQPASEWSCQTTDGWGLLLRQVVSLKESSGWKCWLKESYLMCHSLRSASPTINYRGRRASQRWMYASAFSDV